MTIKTKKARGLHPRTPTRGIMPLDPGFAETAFLPGKIIRIIKDDFRLKIVFY